MGTYAELYSGKDYNTIPDNKKKEFAKRIERLFQEGGMMRIKPNILFGKQVYTIHKVKMGKNGVHFNYNYFEEEEWETAGFDKKNYRVFSEKLGHEVFLEVMVAAYMLEEQYVEETKENIDDMCYWAFWMIYEEMIFSQRLLKAGSVIFAPEGTENKRNGFWEYKRNSKKVLIDDWVSILKEKKNNGGRKILRRYMALMANKKLRYKIFGF